MAASTAYSTGAELAGKLSPKRLPEIRDRALKALASKVELGLLPAEVALEIPGLPQLVLHWLNDRQEVEPQLLNLAFKLLGKLAKMSEDTTRLHEAGCVAFLQDFRPQVPSQCLETLDAALWLLLCHRPEAVEPYEAACSTPLRTGDIQPKELLSPQKTLCPRQLQLETLKMPEVCQTMAEADQQLLLDMSVRLKFSVSSQRSDACYELFQLALNVPSDLLLGLCVCLHDSNATAVAADALCLILERLQEQRLTLVGKCEELPTLWHLLAQVLSGDLSLFARHALRKLLEILKLAEPGPRPGSLLFGQQLGDLPQCGQQMLYCLCHATKALRTHLAPSRQPLRCAAEALDWFRCLGLPDAQSSQKLPWLEPLFSHDWNPGTLQLMDAVLSLLAGIQRLSEAEKLLAKWADESQVIATMVVSLLFDLRLLWERPAAAKVLHLAAEVVASQHAKDFQVFLRLLEEGLPMDGAVKDLGQESGPVGKEVALCQAAQLLQLGLGEAVLTPAELRTHRSVVWLHCRRNFEQNMDQMAPDDMLLAPVCQGVLLCPGYVPQILGMLTPTMWSQGGSLVVRFPDQEQVKVLEHVHDLLRTSPDLQGANEETRSLIMDALKQVGDLVHQRLLPGLHALLTEDDSFGHAKLADAQLMRATELLLRVTLALHVRGNMEHQDMDLSLLTILSSAPGPLPPLALRLAVQMDSQISGASDKEQTSFGEVLLERLSARSNTTSRRHATEIQCTLWLAAKFAPTEAVAYVTPFLQHVDAAVSAAAWRSLRCLLFCRDDYDQEVSIVQKDIEILQELIALGLTESSLDLQRGAVQRALRVLRGWSKEEMQITSNMISASAVAETLEVLRCSVEATGELTKQILESGLISDDGIMAMSFKASHLGLRRVALRFLSTLLAANFQEVAPAIFKAGLWTSAIAAFEMADKDFGEVDTLTVKTDVVLLVMQGTGKDSQLLLWLSKSTAFLHHWLWTLQSLGLALQRFPNPGEGDATTPCTVKLLHLHLMALVRFMELPLEESPDFLFSWQIAVCLGEALQAEMPVETQQLATAALGSWAAIRMKTQATCELCSADETLGIRAFNRILRVLSPDGPDAAVGLAECAATTNLFFSSSIAAASVKDQLTELSVLLQQLSEQRRHQQLIGGMRTFFAALSSSEVLEGALSGSLLTSVLLALRSSADRDQAVCLEFLEQLSYLSEQLQEELLQSEMLSWLMRLSMKKQLPSPGFCCVMNILCLCSDILAGKPLLFRYLGQLMEAIRSLSKTASLPARWKTKRLVAAMNFIGSLRLCSRCTAILTGAASGDSGTRRHLSAPVGAGLDLWFDLAGETKGDANSVAVRQAALRLLLALSEAMPKASVEAWPRLMPLLQARHGDREKRGIDPREGLLQRLAEDDQHAALCEGYVS